MNFSISEILVVLLVALLVIKPDQLPDVAFSLGRFVQSMRRMFVKVKDEVTGLMDTVDTMPSDKHVHSASVDSRHEKASPTHSADLNLEEQSHSAAPPITQHNLSHDAAVEAKPVERFTESVREKQ